MIEDLAYLNAGIDPDRLHAEDLERPVSVKPHITKAGGDVDEESEAADGGSPLEHGHDPVGLGVLHGAPEIEAVWLELKTLGRDGDPRDRVLGSHVEHRCIIHNELVVQAHVVAVGIELLGNEGIDNDLFPEAPMNLFTGQDHCGTPGAKKTPGVSAFRSYPAMFS